MYAINDKAYSEAIAELIGNQTEIKSINFINWWIIKHENLLNRAIADLTDSCCGNKPCIGMIEDCKYTTIHLFKDYYRDIDKMTQKHKFEDYFEKELKSFEVNNFDSTKASEFITKNKSIVDEHFTCFFEDFLSYTENPVHLQNYTLQKNGIALYVNRNDFINTIKFLELYYKLYLEQQYELDK